MKHTLLKVLLSASCIATGLKADILLDVPTFTFNGTQPTQTARLFRDGVGSSWGAQDVFPGLSGAGTIAYTVFNLGILSAVNPIFIQISVFDDNNPTDLLGNTNGAFFAAAYQDTYAPAPTPNATGYRGDNGRSGNAFGNPSFFQVILQPGHALLIPVMEVAAGGGNGRSFGLMVEGFSDANFSPIVPEPGTYLMTASAVGLLFAIGRMRRRNHAAQNLQSQEVA